MVLPADDVGTSLRGPCIRKPLVSYRRKKYQDLIRAMARGIATIAYGSNKSAGPRIDTPQQDSPLRRNYEQVILESRQEAHTKATRSQRFAKNLCLDDIVGAQAPWSDLMQAIL